MFDDKESVNNRDREGVYLVFYFHERRRGGEAEG